MSVTLTNSATPPQLITCNNLPRLTDALHPQTFIKLDHLGLESFNTYRMPFYLRSPEQPLHQDTAQEHPLDKGKSIQSAEDPDRKQDLTNKEQIKETTKDRMAPKSDYYESSRSSSEGERVHYDPRKERRSASKTSTTKRPVEVHHHNTSSGEPKRPSSIDSKRWK